MNNAMVSVPLTEVDALRKRVEDAEYKASQLEAREKKIKVEIREQITNYGTKIDRWGFHTVPVTSWREHPHTYINLDEVIKPIREEEELKVADNTRRLEKQVKDSADTIRQMNETHQEQIKKLKDDHVKEVNVLKGIQGEKTTLELRDATISALNKKLNDLSLENLRLRNRTFLQRVFNIK